MFNQSQDVLNELKSHKDSHLKMIAELGRLGSAVSAIEKMLSKALTTYTSENLVLQPYPMTYRAEGYLYNSIFVGDSAVSDGAKLIIDGIVPAYTVTLVAGENRLDIPDGATYTVQTTSGNPVTSLLTRYNNAR